MRSPFILLLVVSLGFVAVALADEEAGPTRPWENSFARFVEKEGGVHEWFVDTLQMIRKEAVSWLEKLDGGNALLEEYNNKVSNHVFPDRYFSFIPEYVASAIAGHTEESWNATCFQSSSVQAEETATGLTLTFQFQSPSSRLCADNYLLLTTEGVHLVHASRKGEHKVNWKWSSRTNADEKKWVSMHGVRIFKFHDSAPSSVLDLLATIELFSPVILPSPRVPKFAAEANLKFVKDYTGVEMAPRTIQNVDLDEDEIHDGDFVGIIRLDGLDTMQVFGTGAHTGHTAMFLRLMDNSTGQLALYVVESTDKTNYWPKPNIQRTPYREWMKMARAADYQVIVLPLSPASRQIFDVERARKYFESVEGSPYGYHNFIWGWVDTEDDNLPYPLSHWIVEPLFSIVAKIEPSIGDKMWNFAFNKRLNTSGLSTDQIYSLIIDRGISFGQLISMPELDEWVYPDGPSMVCDVLVCSLYKAAGLFGDLFDKIQCVEFQNWDVETLNFFDRNATRPQKCVEADPTSPHCQLAGKYRLEIPDFGTVPPYPKMREHCGALPPKFARKDGC